MNKTQIIKLIKEEINHLEKAPMISLSMTAVEAHSLMLGRQTAYNILSEMLEKIEDNKEERKVDNTSEYLM